MNQLPPLTRYIRFMFEGFDRDDRYRMVEDEFLSIAQRFTVHLYAAEYKRQERLAKARNAEAINSISRPVTGKMPDSTRHKIERLARSKNQRITLQDFLGKREEADDSDDSNDDGLPYVGTTLHGLMDSPRRKSISLSKIRSPGATTRAAAGYQGPSAGHKPSQESISSTPPKSKPALHSDYRNDGLTESSDEDEDDDLDAPILAPKLGSFDRKPASVQRVNVASILAPIASKSIESLSSNRIPVETASNEQLIPSKPVPTPNFIPVSSARAQSATKFRITRRLQQARLQRAKEEDEEQSRKKLDVIPTFL